MGAERSPATAWRLSNERGIDFARLAAAACSALALSLVLLSRPASAGNGPHSEFPGKYVLDAQGGASGEVQASAVITTYLFFPVISRAGLCQGLGETYGTVVVNPGTNDGRPTETHPDKNLAIRGYVETTPDSLDLVDISGPSDPSAPQLPGLFADDRTGVFTGAYQVNSWDWLPYPEVGSAGDPITDPWVTLGGLQVTPGEVIRTPASDYNIGVMPTGYAAMVLYAAPSRVTLTYTRDDTAANGYVLHIENICVEPSLVALYRDMDAAGRTRLPALYSGQGIGRALTNELGVAVRDTGTFMDPRSRKDWWQGR